MGADGVFLALALIGLSSAVPQTVQAAYLAMQMAAWYVIVPLSLASLVTGLIQSLGTQWGLFKHYWIVIKLIIYGFANLALSIHTQPIGRLAAAAADRVLASGELPAARLQLVVAAGGGLALLLVATTLAVFKPRGLTPYGWRAQRARHQVRE